MPSISRRAVLLSGVVGGIAVLGGVGAAVDEGWLPGTRTMRQLLGQDGPAGSIPDVSPARTISGSFVSTRRRGSRTGWTIAYPSQSSSPAVNGASASPVSPRTRLRVLVVLHGRGGDHRQAFGNHLGLDRFLTQTIAHGAPPFAVASVDGGDHGYWHRRIDGSDAGAMVIDEFIPLLAGRGLDTSRVAFLGWSMGGYGALWLSTLLRSPRVAACVAESPAIWRSAAESAAGAFDSPIDFAAHTVFGRERLLDAIPLRIDCGSDDGFAPATRALRARLSPTPAGGVEFGAHDFAYWRRMAPAQLAFVGHHIYT